MAKKMSFEDKEYPDFELKGAEDEKIKMKTNELNIRSDNKVIKMKD